MVECSTAKTLWIVDDEPDFRLFIKEAAERLGWRTHSFANGSLALAKLDAGDTPDAMVLDVFMPEMDGIETIMRLAEYNRKFCVLIATGNELTYASVATHLALKTELQVFDTQTKPLSLQKLDSFLAAC